MAKKQVFRFDACSIQKLEDCSVSSYTFVLVTCSRVICFLKDCFSMFVSVLSELISVNERRCGEQLQA